MLLHKKGLKLKRSLSEMQRHVADIPCVNIISGQCAAGTLHPLRLKFAWSLLCLPPALEVYPGPTRMRLSCLCANTWSLALQPKQHQFSETLQMEGRPWLEAHGVPLQLYA